jgi:hypothetical protein
MAEQLLDGPNVVPRLQQMGGEGVTLMPGPVLARAACFSCRFGAEVHLCRLNGFMTQPESDHRTIHAVLEEIHR